MLKNSVLATAAINVPIFLTSPWSSMVTQLCLYKIFCLRSWLSNYELDQLNFELDKVAVILIYSGQLNLEEAKSICLWLIKHKAGAQTEIERISGDVQSSWALPVQTEWEYHDSHHLFSDEDTANIYKFLRK